MHISGYEAMLLMGYPMDHMRWTSFTNGVASQQNLHLITVSSLRPPCWFSIPRSSNDLLEIWWQSDPSWQRFASCWSASTQRSSEDFWNRLGRSLGFAESKGKKAVACKRHCLIRSETLQHIERLRVHYVVSLWAQARRPVYVMFIPLKNWW